MSHLLFQLQLLLRFSKGSYNLDLILLLESAKNTQLQQENVVCTYTYVFVYNLCEQLKNVQNIHRENHVVKITLMQSKFLFKAPNNGMTAETAQYQNIMLHLMSNLQSVWMFTSLWASSSTQTITVLCLMCNNLLSNCNETT